MKHILAACNERLFRSLPPLSRLEADARAVIDRFDSLGDNCEFGFVKRRLGNNEGGLLRWASTPPEALTAALRDGFANLYSFENLLPFGPKAVLDTAYGLYFHSAMGSREGVWLQDEATRRAIHKTEQAKYFYLREKLLKRIGDPETIFVYKTNPPSHIQNHPEIVGAFRALGPATLLLVEPTRELAQIGSARQAEGHLIGHIDRFAPYANARASSRAWWNIIVEAARLTS